MGFITANRNQIDLLGFSLNDFVPHDTKCRFVVDLVSMLDLSQLYQKYSEQGADAFDPSIILATWFFGYSEGIVKSRKLENYCKRDLHFIYVSGNLRPDHTTLSRFRKANIELVSEYFVQIVQLAIEKGLSDFTEISIDGSKIQASCSAKQSRNSENLEKKLAVVRKEIDVYMTHCDIAEAEELPEDDLGNIKAKIKKLQKLEKRLDERFKQLNERKKELKPEYRKNHKINLIEPDAPMMSGVNGKQKRPSYNTQVGADVKTHFIVSNDVTQDRNDQKQFMKQYQKVESNLGKNPKRKYNLDSGYHSLKQLAFIRNRQIDAIVADPNPQNRSLKKLPTNKQFLLKEGRQLQKTDFVYHAKENYYECPAGKKLMFTRRKRSQKDDYLLYTCNNCDNCLLKKQCHTKRNKSGNRNIRRDMLEVCAENMSQKLETEYAKERLKNRATSVEPVFGNLKENLGFRRFLLRGLDSVKGEFNIMCIAHNINILYKLLSDKPYSKLKIAFEQKIDRFFSYLFNFSLKFNF